MKKKHFKSVFIYILLLSLLSVVWKCTPREDDPVQNNSVSNVVSIVNTGTWKITLFNDSGTDETANFTGYNFTFGTNSVLTATKTSTTHTGTWSITDSNSNDDNINDLHFIISFMAPPDFTDLSEDWSIIEKSSTVIKLKHVSGGNGGTDYLTFTKN